MEITQLFNSKFKFRLNQEVRHRGDSKHGFSNDMGLLILRRQLEEASDDDGNVHYTRNYVCRMIKFSGSGDMALFRENELMSIQEYNQKAVEDEVERDEMRREMHAVKDEIFKSFGVARGMEVYLKKGGEVDKTIVYKVSGFERDEKGTRLSLRREAGEGHPIDRVFVASKDEFEIRQL